ncbi:MAG: hypothetical protein JRI68_35170, partial [Deltaproteobacteria bacterium]|nr:hypothetical protein [Deltaproteobacteria bacterium]
GATTSCEASQDDSSFDFTAEWIDVAGHDPVTTYMVRTVSPTGVVTAWSSVTVDGPPAGGSQDLGFHTPPEIAMASFIDEPISWTHTPSETYDFQWLNVVADGALQGTFEMGAAETETSLPELPSTSDASQLFQGSLRIALGNCAGPRESLSCDKVSYVSRAIH